MQSTERQCSRTAIIFDLLLLLATDRVRGRVGVWVRVRQCPLTPVSRQLFARISYAYFMCQNVGLDFYGRKVKRPRQE